MNQSLPASRIPAIEGLLLRPMYTCDESAGGDTRHDIIRYKYIHFEPKTLIRKYLKNTIKTPKTINLKTNTSLSRLLFTLATGIIAIQ